MKLTEMKVAAIGVDEQGEHVVVLRDDTMEKSLPIWVGSSEARAIALAMHKNVPPPRPLTHNLLISMANSFDYKLREVHVTGLKDGTFLAKIVFEPDKNIKGHSVKELDARPSDAIALATLAQAPIFVTNELLSDNIRIEVRKTEDTDFKRFLGGLKASDFKLDGPLDLRPEED